VITVDLGGLSTDRKLRFALLQALFRDAPPDKVLEWVAIDPAKFELGMRRFENYVNTGSFSSANLAEPDDSKE
jgi:hypothetical protein